jgi:hypothetical protein
MNNKKQDRGSQWGEQNSYGRSQGYERRNRNNYSDDRDNIGFADENDYRGDNGSRFRDDDDSDMDYQNYESGYEEDDEDEDNDHDFQNEYEEDEEDNDDIGYSEESRRGRRGEYEMMDREDVRNIGRRGGSASYGGSSYGSRNFSEEGRDDYRNTGRENNSAWDNSDYDSRYDYRNEDDSDYSNRNSGYSGNERRNRY